MSIFKFNKSLSLLALLPITAFAGTTLQSNPLCLQGAGTMQFGVQTPNNVSTVVDPSNYSYIITNGQPWGGIVNNAVNNNKSCITVKAGRNNNSSNVTWVKTQLSNIGGLKGSLAYTGQGGDSTPGQLNFAIKGLLIVTQNGNEYKCYNFVAGQGHTALSGVQNNWWGFQNYSNATSKYQLQCVNSANLPIPVSVKITGDNTLVFNPQS